MVCYRTDLPLFERCVESLRVQSATGLKLVVVDDCSSAEPRVEPGRAVADVEVIRNATWSGYTRSANRGLRAAAESDVVVLLNSDTELPRQGLEKLVDALQSAPDVGIAGPLSNAASWQSVARRFKSGGGFATNPGVEAVGVDEMDAVVEHVSECTRPSVPLLNGFCMAIRREVIDTIGLLDEQIFPIGYGEENDFVIRAQEAGFKCVVADDTFVYHAKSRSFGNLRRWWYSRRGGITLARKWGQGRIDAMCEEMRHEPTLARMRQSVAEELVRRGHPAFEWD